MPVRSRISARVNVLPSSRASITLRRSSFRVISLHFAAVRCSILSEGTTLLARKRFKDVEE
ncbi:hypothetical protein AAW14_37380 [Streptomyces hygroscopicus]|nr:hypothetical protein [Streptomyces hygroscopicus]